MIKKLNIQQTHILVKQALAVVSLMLLAIGSMAQHPENPSDKSTGIFPKGELGSAENFTGRAWNTGLVASDSTFTTLVGNVYFEPGARSNWHSHPAGQILIITEGIGYHQIKGQPRQELKKGDVITCPPGITHWHGASPQTGMHQLYIVLNTEKGIVQWMQPVTENEYNNQK
jgi:quercetin dioxygenase-like cupin family protein